MAFNPNLQDVPDFICQEVLAVITRQAGFPWRQQINYNSLPPHLQSITGFITPLVNGVNLVGDIYITWIFPLLEYICGTLEQIPMEEKYDWIYYSLLYEALYTVSFGLEDARTFAIMRLISEICLWLIKTNQAYLIPAASSALRYILCKRLPREFTEKLKRLGSFAYAVQNMKVRPTI